MDALSLSRPLNAADLSVMRPDQREILYEALELRMKELAVNSGDVFLANSCPDMPVSYVLVCMEPSMGRATPEMVRNEVERGARNFLSSMEDFILHHCARKYLCRDTETYHITDISKGAMTVESADVQREDRYERWRGLLNEEIEIVSDMSAPIICVGKMVHRFFLKAHSPRRLEQVMHYSPQAARKRNDRVEGLSKAFGEFSRDFEKDELIETARLVMREQSIPACFRDRALNKLERLALSESRKKLAFIYKNDFENIRARAHS